MQNYLILVGKCTFKHLKHAECVPGRINNRFKNVCKYFSEVHERLSESEYIQAFQWGKAQHFSLHQVSTQIQVMKVSAIGGVRCQFGIPYKDLCNFTVKS